MNTKLPACASPSEILKSVFGYDAFRPLQREIIDSILAGRDTLAIMPTGGGKSLCYQVPALIFEGLTVVVSPLIALMKDQVEQLTAAGVPAVLINSSLSASEYDRNMETVRRGETKLLYVAPESLLTPRITSLLAEVRVDCFTIDEAHCISDWGHDFRPDYRQLIEVRKRHPNAVCLALTATATPMVRHEIEKALEFKQSNQFVAGFNRENLYIEVKPKGDSFTQVINFLQKRRGQSGIIYCFTRQQVSELADDLHRAGWSARPYHAGLDDEMRRKNQEAFIRGDTHIMVATIAFGMGINKSNVRFVVHYDIPKSIENYYQEIGRAGRDGQPAHCLLMYEYGDAMRIKRMLQKKTGQDRAIAIEKLEQMIDFARGHHRGCRRHPLLAHFGDAVSQSNCRACDRCASAPPATIVTHPPVALPHGDKNLFERLRVRRKQIADDEGVPAFVVFSDRVLNEIASRAPTTFDELLAISGVGPMKIARYGETFLSEIMSCAQQIQTPSPSA
jgi:ATP-dependent DNA helicase RecQ